MNKSHSQNGSAVIIVIVIAVVLILGGLGYVVWNNFFRTTAETKRQVSNQDTESSDIKDISVTLPNGKVATYPNIKTNMNIVFLAQDESANLEYVKITHTAYKTYLDYLGGNVDDLCGPDDNPKALKKDIIFGLLNTSDKSITYPQNLNCVELIASNENPETNFRAGAQQVLDQVKSDVKYFLESVTIQ